MRLASTAHFDLASGLRNVGGQMGILGRVLRRIVDTCRSGVPALLAGGAPDSTARWREACHSLRAACVCVGATQPATQLQDFEHALAGSAADASSRAAQARRLHEDLAQLAQRLDAALTG